MTATTYPLPEINAIPVAELAAALGHPGRMLEYVAERAAADRPYRTVAALHEALMQAVRAATVR